MEDVSPVFVPLSLVLSSEVAAAFVAHRKRNTLSYAMVGGLVVSQALTLFTTPVVYLYLDRRSNALWRRTGSRKPDDARPAVEHSSRKHAAE